MDFDEAKIAFHIMLCHWCVDWKLEILNCHKDSTKIVKNPSLSQVFYHFAAWQHAHIIPSIQKVTFDKTFRIYNWCTFIVDFDLCPLLNQQNLARVLKKLVDIYK